MTCLQEHWLTGREVEVESTSWGGCDIFEFTEILIRSHRRDKIAKLNGSRDNLLIGIQYWLVDRMHRVGINKGFRTPFWWNLEQKTNFCWNPAGQVADVEGNVVCSFSSIAASSLASSSNILFMCRNKQGFFEWQVRVWYQWDLFWDPSKSMIYINYLDEGIMF